MDKSQFRDLAIRGFLGDLFTFRCWVRDLIQTRQNGSTVIKLLFEEEVTPTFGAIYFLLRAANLLEPIERGLLAEDTPGDVTLTSEFEQKWNDAEILCGGLDGLARKLSERFDDHEVCVDKLVTDISAGDTFEWTNQLIANTTNFRGVVEIFKTHDLLEPFQAWLFNLPVPKKAGAPIRSQTK